MPRPWSHQEQRLEIPVHARDQLGQRLSGKDSMVVLSPASPRKVCGMKPACAFLRVSQCSSAQQSTSKSCNWETIL